MVSGRQAGIREAVLESEARLMRRENAALRRQLATLQGEVYGARLAAKYLDKELAGRYAHGHSFFLTPIFTPCGTSGTGKSTFVATLMALER